MARLTVIADDLTGALDTGVQFANRCVSVRVAAVHGTAAVHEELFQADVAVIDAEVRHRSRQQAYKICLELVQQAQRCGTDSVYIKTDSGLRGNIGAMFQAALDASGAAVAYYAPALPRMNRLTQGGIQYIDGVPINESVFGQDPFEPVRSPYIKDLFKNCRAEVVTCQPRNLPPPPQHGQQIVICDAEKDTDFRCIAMELQRTNGLKILGGCAGFAAVLPPFLGLEGGPISLPCINAPLLVLCGSLNPITKRQLEYGAAHGGVRISLQSEQLAAGYFESRAGQDFLTQIEQRMQGGCDMLIDTDGTDTAEDADTAEQLRGQIAEQLGLLMALLLERPAADNYLPMIIGGDTLMGFMQQLSEAEISPLGEAAPGAVLFTAPMHELEDGEVLLKVKGCGICAGDLKAFHGGIRVWGTSEADRYMEPPCIPGHEFYGEVVDIKGEVPGIAIGDDVCAEQVVPCGHCHFCRTGKYWMCQRSAVFGFKKYANGGFAEYVKLPKASLKHVLPKSFTKEQSVLVEPIACGMHALEQANIQHDDVVVIAGLGAIGTSMCNIANLKMPKLVIGLEVREERARRAREYGADIVLNPVECNVVEEIMKLTGGLGCDVYVEASGSPKSAAQGLNCLRNHGRYVQMGVLSDLVTADWNTIGDGKELTIIGSHLSAKVYPAVIRGIEKGLIKTDGLISHCFKLQDWAKAYETAEKDPAAVKIMLEP